MSSLNVIGNVQIGTNYAVTPGGSGGVDSASVLFLNAGTYIVSASGYNPLDGNVTNQATSAVVARRNADNSYTELRLATSLSYRFNLCGIVTVDSNNTRVDLRVINWEGSSKQVQTNLFTFAAIRIK